MIQKFHCMLFFKNVSYAFIQSLECHSLFVVATTNKIGEQTSKPSDEQNSANYFPAVFESYKLTEKAWELDKESLS